MSDIDEREEFYEAQHKALYAAGTLAVCVADVIQADTAELSEKIGAMQRALDKYDARVLEMDELA